MRPIVHIGYHKTATTWFQRHVYPAATSHRFVPRAIVQQALLDPPGTAFDRQAALDLLTAGDDGRPLLLCEENLSGYLHNGGLHGFLAPALAHRIKALFPDAHILIFVRSQVAMAAACYTQYVKGGGTHALSRYLFPAAFLRGAYAQPFKVPRFAFDHLEYDRLIAYYDDLFGRGNVHVYPYEALADQQALLRRMEKDLGLELDQARVSFGRANVSWSGRMLPAARFLNHFTARTVEDKHYLLHLPGFYLVRGGALIALRRIFRDRGRTAVIGPALSGWIERRFAASNARLRALRPDLLSPCPLPPDLYPAGADAAGEAAPRFEPERPPLRALFAVKWTMIALAAFLLLLGAATAIRWIA